MEDFESLKPLREFVGNDGLTYYVGECGGCGTQYSTTDWNDAVNGVCPQDGGGDSTGHGPVSNSEGDGPTSLLGSN